MKKLKIISIASILSFLALSVLVGVSTNRSLSGYADLNGYVLQLNSSNGAITSGSYLSSVATIKAKTKLGNDVSLATRQSLKRTDDIGQLSKDSTSYYMNTSPILGLYKVEINYAFSSTSDANASISIGDYDGTTFQSAYTQKLTASTAYTTYTYTDFGGDYSYFKIHSNSGNARALYIKTINVYYTCKASSDEGGNDEPTVTNVTGVSVSPETLSLEKGATYGLTKTISPSDATDTSVTWSSNNNNVATVDSNGVVTGVAKGNATITCLTNDGGFTDTCLVTVTETEVEEPEETSSSYKLVKSVSDLVDGANVVLVSRESGVIAGELTSQYLSSVTFDSLESNTTEFENIPDSAIEFKLEKSGTSWKFKYGDSYLGATAVKKLAFDSNTTWNISISDDDATIQNTESSLGKFLYNVQSPRFTTYATASSSTMLVPQLFIFATNEGESEEPDTPVVPEEPATLDSINATLSKTTYEYGETFDKNSLTITGVYSDNSTTTFTFNDVDEYICYDENLNDIDLDKPLTSAGEYILSLTIDGIESNTLSFYVNEEETKPSSSNATISIGVYTNTSTDIGNDANSYVTSTGVEISSVSGSKIYGLGSGVAGFKLGSSSATGSITFKFTTNVVISGVSIGMDRYNSKSSVVKVSTSANTTGETISLNQDYKTNGYNCTAFTNDSASSNSLTIASTTAGADKRFNLYSIVLTLGVAQQIPVTGVSLPVETLSLNTGASYQLNPTVLPTNASNKGVTYTSSNTTVATVSDVGVISALNAGQTTITVKTKEGNFTDSLTLTVVKNEVNYSNYYKATNLNKDLNLKEVMEMQDCSSIPAGEGTRNILVIPVELTDYQFSSKTLSDLEIAFNGQSEETYWESVSSFYSKSSYGKINLEFEIADVYKSGYTAKSMSNISTNDNYPYFTNKILEYVVSDYISDNGSSSTKKFDSDSDGMIDAVWMIYSCPNYSNLSTLSDDYWAYVYWNNWNATPSTSSPKGGAYGWASYDFMYEKGSNTIDAHTYIHETGHLFGLDDYYNYDNGESSDRVSLSGVDMMDYNVIDHNSYSKMLLGWNEPYVVTGNAEITISAATTSGDCILIPDTSGWNGTCYDEYILLELYSPTGLNQKDASTSYNSAKVFTQAGVRLYHVDSRLAKFSYSYSSGWGFTSYVEPTNVSSSSTTYSGFAHSNTPSYSVNSKYELIHMVQAGGTNTYSYGGSANNSDLFKTGSTFSMSQYSGFFANKTKFNNGNAFNYTIQFVSVSSNSATIRIIAN